MSTVARIRCRVVACILITALATGGCANLPEVEVLDAAQVAFGPVIGLTEAGADDGAVATFIDRNGTGHIVFSSLGIAGDASDSALIVWNSGGALLARWLSVLPE